MSTPAKDVAIPWKRLKDLYLHSPNSAIEALASFWIRNEAYFLADHYIIHRVLARASYVDRICGPEAVPYSYAWDVCLTVGINYWEDVLNLFGLDPEHKFASFVTNPDSANILDAKIVDSSGAERTAVEMIGSRVAFALAKDLIERNLWHRPNQRK